MGQGFNGRDVELAEGSIHHAMLLPLRNNLEQKAPQTGFVIIRRKENIQCHMKMKSVRLHVNSMPV